jgi:hypothetical protein
LEDRLERHARLLYKHANKGFAVVKAAEVTGVSDKEAGCPPDALKTDLKSPLRGAFNDQILPGEEADGAETLRRWREYRSQRQLRVDATP